MNNKIEGKSIYNNNNSSRYNKTISNYKDGYAHGNKELTIQEES